MGATGADGAWFLLGSAILGANASDLTVSGLTAKKYLRIEVRIAGYSANSTARLRFNDDTGANYSFRRQDNNSATSSGTAQSGISVAQASITGSNFFSADIRNLATQAKTVVLEGMSGSESASVAPTINRVRGVWGNTSSQITSITVNSGGSVNLLAGTEIIVWGSD